LQNGFSLFKTRFKSIEQGDTRMAETSLTPPKTFDTGAWVLFSTILASSMAFIDGSALNIALPSLQNDLAASGGELLWIVNAYALLLAALIIVAGSLGDHFGRKRVFMSGILIFTFASLLGGLAPTTLILIVARAVQGIGGALMVPGSLAIISAYFPASSRGKAIGIWSSFTTFTTIIGPILGGVFAEIGFWRGVFFINIPLAAAALYGLYFHVPESRDEEVVAKPLDIWGSILITLALAGITYGFIEAPSRGWENPLIMVSLLGGLLCLGIFVIRQRTAEFPMIPLSLFQSRTFTGTNVMTLFLYGALSGALFFVPLNLVQIQGYSQDVTGLALLPFALLLALMSRWAGGLIDRYGPRLPLSFGPAITGMGFLALSFPGLTNGAEDYWTSFFPGIFLIGVGMGITVAPLTTAVMGSVSQNRAGIASGVNNAVARSAGVLAIAILGSIALISFETHVEANIDPLPLPDNTRAEFLDTQVERLGDAEPPPSLELPVQQAMEKAIHTAFISAYRLVNSIAAVLCWISALMAWLIVEKHPMT
jgi:EmrB/QacA subfamily drug resistance transporter